MPCVAGCHLAAVGSDHAAQRVTHARTFAKQKAVKMLTRFRVFVLSCVTPSARKGPVHTGAW